MPPATHALRNHTGHKRNSSSGNTINQQPTSDALLLGGPPIRCVVAWPADLQRLICAIQWWHNRYIRHHHCNFGLFGRAPLSISILLVCIDIAARQKTAARPRPSVWKYSVARDHDGRGRAEGWEVRRRFPVLAREWPALEEGCNSEMASPTQAPRNWPQ